MTWLRTAVLTSVAMVAFAGNSLLCRAALRHTTIDAASFTSLRLVSGALMLALLVGWRSRSAPAAAAPGRLAGDWLSAAALFAYAASFSFAYVQLSAATGALLLFGAVQATMIGWGLSRGERLRPLQWLGLTTAVTGLVVLLLPGLTAPPWASAALMALSGLAWGVYSLRGRASAAAGATGPRADATAVTSGNFLRAAPMALLLSALLWPLARWDAAGALLSLASGALASGLGYAVWYTALRGLNATCAAIVQLSVPAIAAGGAVLLLGEPLTARLALTSVAVLGGVARVIVGRPGARG